MAGLSERLEVKLANPATSSEFDRASAREGVIFVITLTVNGERREIDVPADMPLLCVLRDGLGLIGNARGVWRALRANILGMVACLGLVGMVSVPCRALDYQPFDWVPAKPGVNVMIGYYEYGKYNEYNNFRTGTVTYDTNLDSNIGILRYIHYGAVLGLHTFSTWLCLSARFPTERLAARRWDPPLA